MKQNIKRGLGDCDSSYDKSPAQHTAFAVQGRRVRRACERCRTKKTKVRPVAFHVSWQRYFAINLS